MSIADDARINVPDRGVTMSIPEAIYIVRQDVKRREQLVEELYKSGQGDLARLHEENADVLNAMCLTVINRTAKRGVWKQVGFHESADGSWDELLSGNGFVISRPYSSPFPGENNGSGTCPQDSAPAGYEPKSLALAKAVVYRQLICSDIEPILRPSFDDLPWGQHEDWD